MSIRASEFGGGLRRGALPLDQFAYGSSAQDRNDRFIYNFYSGRLYFDPDGTGRASQKMIAVFENRVHPAASNIHIF